MDILFLFTTIVLFLLCIQLWQENKELKKNLQNFENQEQKKKREYLSKNTSKEDTFSVQQLSMKEKEKFLSSKQEFQKIQNIMEKSNQNKKREVMSSIPRKPEFNLKSEIQDTVSKSTVSFLPKNHSVDFSELVKRSEVTSSSIENNTQNKDYLENLSKRLEEEIKPQTIELTDYEKDQEENAIISYQELLSTKDHPSMPEEKINNQQLLEELKNFRNHLR